MANILTEIKVVANEEEYSFGGGMREVHDKVTKSNVIGYLNEIVTLEEGWRILKYHLYVRGTGMDSTQLTLECETGSAVASTTWESQSELKTATVSTSVTSKDIKGCALNWDAKNLRLRKPSNGTISQLSFEYWVYY